jgi:transposase IS116/IS110/IS902 family protein
MLHRTLHLLIRQQTAVINAIRAHLAEFGIVAPVGRNGVEQLLGVVADSNEKRLPEVARACVAALGAQLRMLKEQILEFDRMIRAWHRSSEMSMRLDDCPGVGPALATALVATVADPKVFRSGRNFSAWIGLVPKQHSSGGKDRLGSISKQGDRYLRSLFGLSEKDAATAMQTTLAGSSQTSPTYWLNPKTGVSYPVSIQTRPRHNERTALVGTQHVADPSARCTVCTRSQRPLLASTWGAGNGWHCSRTISSCRIHGRLFIRSGWLWPIVRLARAQFLVSPPKIHRALCQSSATRFHVVLRQHKTWGTALLDERL